MEIVEQLFGGALILMILRFFVGKYVKFQVKTIGAYGNDCFKETENFFFFGKDDNLKLRKIGVY